MMLLTNLAAAAALLIPTAPEAVAPQLTMAPKPTQSIEASIDASIQRAVGRVGGPGHVSERVEARGVDFYNITFEGGALAQVLVEGDGDTDLDLYVFDSEGNLVASDTDLTDVCLGSWVPGKTETFRVEIHNLGTVYNAYEMTTN
ncbi:MAG: hypothetical protein AAF196_14780 [Planctomycetota bacterium]